MKSRRPPNIAPEFWSFMTPKDRDEAAQKYRNSLLSVDEQLGANLPAAASVFPIMPRLDFPVMPRMFDSDPRWATADGDYYSFHRDRGIEDGARGMALVARPVKPKEVKENPKAKASLDVEYNALCNDLKAWDMSGVREWFDVQALAKRD